MPLTIQVFSPSGETTATLTAITGTGTAANPYTITQQGSSQFGTITVLDAANLLGLWQWKVGTRAIGRVLIVAGQSDYPIQSNQQAAAAAITAAGLATAAVLGTPAGASIAADIAAIEGGGGLTGDFTLTVTVTDADDSEPIENATVTLSRTGERGAELTDDDGVAVLGLDAATWSWVVRAAGYESRTGTVVVSANGTLAVELDGIVVDSAESPICAVTLPVVNQYGVRIAGVSVSFKFAGLQPNANPGAVIMSPPPTLTSGIDGTVRVNLIRLARYTATYKIDGETRNIAIAVPDAGAFNVVEG
jgi:hypothetical protein